MISLKIMDEWGRLEIPEEMRKNWTEYKGDRCVVEIQQIDDYTLSLRLCRSGGVHQSKRQKRLIAGWFRRHR